MDLSRRELFTASALILAPSDRKSRSLLRAHRARASGTSGARALRFHCPTALDKKSLEMRAPTSRSFS